MAANQGKNTEALIRDWLQVQSDIQFDFSFHRYPDSRSARNVIAAQPSDYLVANGARKKVFHVEVKETAKLGRLHKSKIRQLGMLRKYWHAGIQPLVIVFITETQMWCVLEADHLFNHEEMPVSYELRKLAMYAGYEPLLEAFLL